MNGIEKIDIRINSLTSNMDLTIIPDALKVYAKGKEKSIDAKVIGELLDIICKWDFEYIDDSAIDAEQFRVKVYTAKGVDDYFGNGKYPNNYDAFKKLVNDIYG